MGIEIKDIKSLEEFAGWDNTDSAINEIDFFGENLNPAPLSTEKIVDEVDNDDVTPPKKEETEPKKPTGDDLFKAFNLDDEPAPDKDDDDDDDPPAPGDDPDPNEGKGKKPGPKSETIRAVKMLKDKGVLDFELEEGEELTEEKAEALLEDGFDQGVETRIEEMMADLPPQLKQLNKFVLSGGSMNQILSAMSQAGSGAIKKGLDMSVEANQELVMLETLKQDHGYDDETAQAQVDFLKDSGRLAGISSKRYEKWEEDRENKEAALLEQQRKARLKSKESRRAFKKEIATFLKDKEDHSGMKISRTDKKELPSYMTDQSVKLENGKEVTQMQYDLYQALQDKEKSILLAKLLKSGFSFEDIQTQAKNQVTDEVLENLRRNKNNKTPKSANGSSQNKKSFADYF